MVCQIQGHGVAETRTCRNGALHARNAERRHTSACLEGAQSEREGTAFFELTKREGLEGIVAKRKDGKYHIGKRTRDWLKIKVMQDEDLLICGYQSDEEGKVKDLILGYFDEEGKLQCRGKVYLGISKEERRIIEAFAKNNLVSKPWFAKYRNAVWLKPQLVGTAHFMHETQSGSMRQPVWKGLREDK